MFHINSILGGVITLRVFSRKLVLSICAITFVLLSPSVIAANIPQPDGYRLELYDDLVPDGLDGATTVSGLQIKDLQQSVDIVIVDVIPEHRKPDFLPENQMWFPVPHRGLVGALWLPDVGFGVLSEVTENYFKKHLLAATNADLETPLVFYCRANCWMSWNAAKRALSFGYRRVYWYTDGIEDWDFEGFDFAVLQPAEGKRQAD